MQLFTAALDAESRDPPRTATRVTATWRSTSDAVAGQGGHREDDRLHQIVAAMNSYPTILRRLNKSWTS
jgi:hypothetical protein